MINPKGKTTDQFVTSKSTQSINFSDDETPKRLRPITPADTFPCFSCYDKPIHRMKCDVCMKRGFLYGNHPMVRFVDDFIEKNFEKMVKSQESGEDCRGSLLSQCFSSGDDKIPMHNHPKKNKMSLKNSFSYSQKDSIIENQTIEPPTQIHFEFICDDCEEDPIKGTRYHCQTCDDFDLCGRCMKDSDHQHPLSEINIEIKNNASRQLIHSLRMGKAKK